MIYVSKILPFKGYIAMAFCGVIFVRKDLLHKFSNVVENHERIHLQQQKELTPFVFLIQYLFSYISNLTKYGNHNKAYKNIYFEREAYHNESNLNYISTREKNSYNKYRDDKYEL